MFMNCGLSSGDAVIATMSVRVVVCPLNSLTYCFLYIAEPGRGISSVDSVQMGLRLIVCSSTFLIFFFFYVTWRGTSSLRHVISSSPLDVYCSWTDVYRRGLSFDSTTEKVLLRLIRRHYLHFVPARR